jgi:hypothetical protein
MTVKILVEGGGDVRSVPILLARTLGRPHKVECIDMGGKSNIVRLRDGFEGTIARKAIEGFSQFAVLVDQDSLRPYSSLDEEQREMQKRAKSLETEKGVRISLFWAKREYESWLIGGLKEGDSPCDLQKLSKGTSGDTEAAPPDPKAWLREHSNEELSEPERQVCLSGKIDWTKARKKNRSLREFIKGMAKISA